MSGRNRNFVQQGNRLMLQAISAYYIPPKEPIDIKEDIPNYNKLTVAELRQKITR